MGLNATEATKNNCCANGKDAVDHSKVIWWFLKFCSGCKNLNGQARPGGSKSMDSKP